MLRWFNRIATVTAVAVTALALATLTLGLVGGRFGYRAVFMTTGSMRPAIAPGDLVILRPVDPTSIRVGDVITFQAPVGRHELVTHRVVAMTTSAQGPEFKTRGDANQVADIWTVRYQGLGWTDSGRKDAIGGLAREFYRRVKSRYDRPDAWRQQRPDGRGRTKRWRQR